MVAIGVLVSNELQRMGAFKVTSSGASASASDRVFTVVGAVIGPSTRAAI